MSSSLSNMNLWGEATQLCRRLCFVRSSRLGTVATNQSPQLSGIYCKAAYHKVHDEHRDVQSFAAGPPRLMTSGIDCNKLLVQETMRKTWQWYLELWDSMSWPQDRYVDRDFATLRACFPVESKNDEVTWKCFDIEITFLEFLEGAENGFKLFKTIFFRLNCRQFGAGMVRHTLQAPNSSKRRKITRHKDCNHPVDLWTVIVLPFI